MLRKMKPSNFERRTDVTTVGDVVFVMQVATLAATMSKDQCFYTSCQ
jgi:hypothetical protein